MKRPQRRPERPELDETQKQALAARAIYEGSPEHKVVRWWGGRPAAFVDEQGRTRRSNPNAQLTTPCPLTTEQDRSLATAWLRAAIAAGQYRFVEGHGEFPRYVWYQDDQGRCWKGRAINVALGTYKGWPISEDEYRALGI